MNARQVVLALGLVVAVAVGAGVWWHFRPGGEVAQPLDMDRYQAQLTERAKSLGADPTFQVVITGGEFPIGTLLRDGRSLGMVENDIDCLPSPLPSTYAAPSLFPDVTVSRALAGNLQIEAPIKALEKAGFKAGVGDGMKMAVGSAGLMVLSGDNLKALLARADCRKALAGRELVMVRGYIVGQRNFVLDSKADVNLTAAGAPAGFDLGANGARSISITDKEPRKFLQIISVVSAPADVTKPVEVVAPPAAGARPGGRVFVQRDAIDDPATGALVVSALSDQFRGDPPVERTVEAIDSRKMPSAPQVRYFNEDDKPLAEAAAGVLAARGIKAGVVRVSLPAPAKQLEVWLQRKGPGPTANIGGMNVPFELPVSRAVAVGSQVTPPTPPPAKPFNKAAAAAKATVLHAP